MKRLWIKFLLKIKVVRFIKDRMLKYGAELGTLNSVYPYLKREYHIKEKEEVFVVYMKVVNEDMDTTAVVNIFPKSDDPEYAKLCAEELLDKLNEEV